MNDLVIKDATNYKNELQEILTNLGKGKNPTGKKLINKNLFANNLEKCLNSLNKVTNSINNNLFPKINVEHEESRPATTRHARKISPLKSRKEFMDTIVNNKKI